MPAFTREEYQGRVRKTKRKWPNKVLMCLLFTGEHELPYRLRRLELYVYQCLLSPGKSRSGWAGAWMQTAPGSPPISPTKTSAPMPTIMCIQGKAPDAVCRCGNQRKTGIKALSGWKWINFIFRTAVMSPSRNRCPRPGLWMPTPGKLGARG